MSSIVLDLQNEVTKPDCDIVSVLRKAHLIAAKLGLTDFDKWIICELMDIKMKTRFPTIEKLEDCSKHLTHLVVGYQL